MTRGTMKGATLTAATSTFTADILDITPPGWTRGKIDTTKLNTPDAGANQKGNKTSIPSAFIEAGDVPVKIEYDASYQPPIDAEPEVWTLMLPLQTGETTAEGFSFLGYLTEFQPDTPMDDRHVADVVLAISGPVTFIAST